MYYNEDRPCNPQFGLESVLSGLLAPGVQSVESQVWCHASSRVHRREPRHPDRYDLWHRAQVQTDPWHSRVSPVSVGPVLDSVTVPRQGVDPLGHRHVSDFAQVLYPFDRQGPR